MSAQLLPGPGMTAEQRFSSDKKGIKRDNAFACPRDFVGNHFTYLTLSPRARGLSIGINVNPNRQCNFDCVYCEVDRSAPSSAEFNPDIAALELQEMLGLVHSGGLAGISPYADLPAELLKLRHVALSGDGEPTLSPRFLEAVETVVHVRAVGPYPFFKTVLITNASGLDRPEVQSALQLLTPGDEIWAKLEAGSQRVMDAINRGGETSLEKILANILLIARRRPVVIQSLFCQIGSVVPSAGEIEEYALRLRGLREEGAQISLVQIYSATRPTPHSEIRHLPLKSLAEIAECVRRIAGLKAEPF